MKVPKAHPPSPHNGATSSRKPRRSGFGLWPLDFGPRDRDGVALVITLIMLAVITFMAIAFLVLSQRERGSSNTAMDQKTAQMAADTAFNRVCAEMLADAMVNTNFNSFGGLKVSTNYISYAGFVNGVSAATNVNYDHTMFKRIFTGGATEWERNISDLEYNPRPPVFVATNSLTGASEFRFYLDLNRNGRFDTNVLAPVVAPDGGYYSATNPSVEWTPAQAIAGNVGPILSNYFGGDPEWIGVLERPREMHSADNQFNSRYAYLVIPVSGTLDLNTMHNETRDQSLAPSPNDGYVRNEGTGPWELNLAAFFADLNTNIWFTNGSASYQYNQANLPPAGPSGNRGADFDTARAFLNYRYGGNYLTLNRATQLFGSNAAPLLNGADWYSVGNPYLSQYATNVISINNTKLAWAGAPNTNHYWDLTADLFDPSKTPPDFAATLANLGTSNDTYNSTTFYRLLSQLGTDSAPERNKLNVNWKNTDSHGNIIPGMETNLIGWTPLDFFYNAAQRMFQQLNLRDMSNNLISITNIPIYETPAALLRAGGTNYTASINYYTPAVHRVLQLAANIYDATHSRFLPVGSAGPTNYPSVFRPVFKNYSGIASIVGYMEVTNDTAAAFNLFMDASNFVAITPQGITNQFVNINGIPWVIGAKKGFPNFNEMSMVNQLQVTRKLQFTNTLGHPGLPNQTNQIFEFGVSNAFGAEFWNPYVNGYGRPLRLFVTNELSLQLTNENNVTFLSVNQGFGTNRFFAGWPGCNIAGAYRGVGDASFQVPLEISTTFTNAIYLQNGSVVPLTPPPWPVSFAPHFWMGLNYRFHAVLIDTSVNRIVDFVNLVGPPPSLQVVDVISNLSAGENLIRDNSENNFADIWETNIVNGNVVLGVLNLIDANKGQPAGLPGLTTGPNGTLQQFQRNINGNGTTPGFQNEDSAVGIVNELFSWSANDPLVHYTAPDLTAPPANTAGGGTVQYNKSPPQSDADGASLKVPPKGGYLPNLGILNTSYQPWGGYPLNPNNATLDRNTHVKDPLMTQADNWDFPTNSLPGIGWLGRVHRGTPWQTVYMKPVFGLKTTDWANWVNDNVAYTNYYKFGNGSFAAVATFDALSSYPSLDYNLFDLFTSSVSESAASGHLNVNQPGLADWSAALSGVNVLVDSGSGAIPGTISPAGVYSPSAVTPLAQIVQGINFTRTNLDPRIGPVFPNQSFQHVGDILNVPQLTDTSPFVNTNSLGANSGINDEVLERIPQQVMSLLTLNQSPRFVIYSFGQTLHPADHSLVIGGPFNNLCTNYQITAESATRAVVRVDGSPDPQYTPAHPDPLGRFYPPHIVVEQFNVLGPE